MTRLVDLEPHWLTPDVFIFKNPTGGTDLLTCKRVAMSRSDQQALIYKQNPQYLGRSVVMTVPEMAWQFEGNDFETLTVSPSIDCSSSGNWHGFVRNGEVT